MRYDCPEWVPEQAIIKAFSVSEHHETEKALLKQEADSKIKRGFLYQEVQMLKTDHWRKFILFLLFFVDILPVILIIFGLYIRLSGVGSPVGSIYILIASLLGIGTMMVWFVVFWRPKRTNHNSETQQMRQSRPMPKDE